MLDLYVCLFLSWSLHNGYTAFTIGLYRWCSVHECLKFVVDKRLRYQKSCMEDTTWWFSIMKFTCKLWRRGGDPISLNSIFMQSRRSPCSDSSRYTAAETSGWVPPSSFACCHRLSSTCSRCQSWFSQAPELASRCVAGSPEAPYRSEIWPSASLAR